MTLTLMSLIPCIGTRSLPVKNKRNFFLSSSGNSWKVSQNHLKHYYISRTLAFILHSWTPENLKFGVTDAFFVCVKSQKIHKMNEILPDLWITSCITIFIFTIALEHFPVVLLVAHHNWHHFMRSKQFYYSAATNLCDEYQYLTMTKASIEFYIVLF